MKYKFLPLLVLAMAVLVACGPTTPTTPSSGDSTVVAAVDSTPVVTDTSAVVDVPVVTVDSPATTPPPVDNNGKKAGADAPDPITTTYRMTVSFISKGGGIDSKAKVKFDAFVAGYETTNKVKLAHETVTWGREGEVDYCYKLAELKDPKKTAFVRESMALLTGNDRVQFKENANCRVKRK
jgi:hypothetical protein